jgi:ribonuclease BN (tRNA processing enzyme)
MKARLCCSPARPASANRGSRRPRAQSSNLLVVNGTLYLIDAGGGVTRRIVQAGYDFRKVGKIFITHAHSDHTAGIATLLVSEWEYQRAETPDIAKHRFWFDLAPATRKLRPHSIRLPPSSTRS